MYSPILYIIISSATITAIGGIMCCGYRFAFVRESEEPEDEIVSSTIHVEGTLYNRAESAIEVEAYKNNIVAVDIPLANAEIQ